MAWNVEIQVPITPQFWESQSISSDSDSWLFFSAGIRPSSEDRLVYLFSSSSSHITIFSSARESWIVGSFPPLTRNHHCQGHSVCWRHGDGSGKRRRRRRWRRLFRRHDPHGAANGATAGAHGAPGRGALSQGQKTTARWGMFDCVIDWLIQALCLSMCYSGPGCYHFLEGYLQSVLFFLPETHFNRGSKILIW